MSFDGGMDKYMVYTYHGVVCVCVLSHSVVSDSFYPMDCSPRSSSDHGISQGRIVEWLPFPPPGDLPNQGIERKSPVCPKLAGGFCTTELPVKPIMEYYSALKKGNFVICNNRDDPEDIVLSEIIQTQKEK